MLAIAIVKTIFRFLKTNFQIFLTKYQTNLGRILGGHVA